MANALYAKALEGFLGGNISWSTDTIKCVLVTAAYTPATSTDQYLSIIPSDSIIATSGALASKTVTSGVADAADVTFTTPAASSVKYIVVYQDTGTDSTSRLIANFDTAAGLPATLNGTNSLLIAWDSGANKIFAV